MHYHYDRFNGSAIYTEEVMVMFTCNIRLDYGWGEKRTKKGRQIKTSFGLKKARAILKVLKDTNYKTTIENRVLHIKKV